MFRVVMCDVTGYLDAVYVYMKDMCLCRLFSLVKCVA